MRVGGGRSHSRPSRNFTFSPGDLIIIYYNVEQVASKIETWREEKNSSLLHTSFSLLFIIQYPIYIVFSRKNV